MSIVLGKMLDQTGYLKDLRDENSEEANERIENLMELVSAARDYETREAEASLGGFVDRLSLLSEADEESGSRDARVWLMTMHAAKGLEFPVVIIAGLEEGLFPHSRAGEDEEEIEEERRLCYVGHDARAVAAWCSRAPRGAACSASTSRPSRHASSTRFRPSSSSASRRPATRRTRARSATATTSSARTRTRARAAAQGAGSRDVLRVRERGSVGVRTAHGHARAARRSSASARSMAVEEHNDDLKITVRLRVGRREEAAVEVREARAGVERSGSTPRR